MFVRREENITAVRIEANITACKKGNLLLQLRYIFAQKSTLLNQLHFSQNCAISLLRYSILRNWHILNLRQKQTGSIFKIYMSRPTKKVSVSCDTSMSRLFKKTFSKVFITVCMDLIFLSYMHSTRSSQHLKYQSLTLLKDSDIYKNYASIFNFQISNFCFINLYLSI